MTRSIVYVWTEGDRHFDTLTLFNLVRSRVPVKWRRPFIGRRHCTMAAPTFSMAAAIPEIRDLVRYKQFLKVNMAASSSDEQSSHQNTFAS